MAETGVSGLMGIPALTPDELQGLVGASGGLLVDGYEICSRLHEVADVPRRVLDHQVDVEGQLGAGSETLNDRRSEGQVGDEHPVHDVQVHPVGSESLDAGDLLPYL